MATQKTYFVFPGVFEYFRDSQGVFGAKTKIEFVSYKIAGVEQLQNTPVSAGILDNSDAELSDCNQDMSTCNIGGINDSYNPFYNYVRMDFPIINGVARGTSTGSTNGVNYGFNSLNLTVDKVDIFDEFGISRKGSFAIDIDYDYDFYLAIRISTSPTAAAVFPYGDGVYFEIRHTASICESKFTYTEVGSANIIDCYSYGFLKGTTASIDPILVPRDYHILPSCYELIPVDVCEGYSGYSIGIIARPPEDETPQIIKKTCCDELKVFAELTSRTKGYKNDYKSLIFNRQVATDTYDFKLVKCSTGSEYTLDGSSPYGVFYDYGDFEGYPNYTGFRLEWFDVLNDLGAGKYQLVIDYDILGTTGQYVSCLFNLQVYSLQQAAYTVRFDSVLNSYYEHQNIDLTGVYWEDSIRVPGIFGRRQINYEEDSLIYRGREVNDVKTEYINEYSFQSELLTRCSSPVLVDWILRGDRIKVSDFNPYAHQDYKEFPVKMNNPEEIRYFERNDKIIFEAKFGDRKQDFRKL